MANTSLNGEAITVPQKYVPVLGIGNMNRHLTVIMVVLRIYSCGSQKILKTQIWYVTMVLNFFGKIK
jgi:hypothetical protein